jgi:hypothetical protein
LAGLEQVDDAMNCDTQTAGKLLTELREAYRRLPQPIQAHVAHLLRESNPEAEPSNERVN